VPFETVSFACLKVLVMKFLAPFLFFLFSSIAVFATDTTLRVRTSDSVELYVHCKGKGTPVLFIHGGPGSTSGYLEYTGGPAFEKEATMIYLDQRGCGRSSNAADKNNSLDRMIQDFEEVRKALGLEQWIIMPHSFGGIMGTAYAAKYPAAVKAIIYLNSTLNIDSSAQAGINKSIELLEQKGLHYPALKSDTIPLLTRWFEAFGKLRDNDLFYPLMFATKKAFEYHDSVTQAHAHSWDFGNQVWGYKDYFADFLPVSATIQCPVLVIGGTKDYTIGIHHPELMRFPHMQIKYVEGGHALYYENTENLLKAIRPFLKKYALKEKLFSANNKKV
jgi:proline iminopeptidase